MGPYPVSILRGIFEHKSSIILIHAASPSVAALIINRNRSELNSVEKQTPLKSSFDTEVQWRPAFQPIDSIEQTSTLDSCSGAFQKLADHRNQAMH